MFHISKDGIKSSAFQVSTATFDGTDFTGPPFHGNVNHDWLQKAISAGVVSLLPNNKAEPAVWGVQTGPGEIVLASPGDYLVRPVGTETIHVCSGPLWELLTEPLVEGIESDEANWPEAISTLTLLFRETATRLRSGGIPDWGIFMDDLRAKIDEITNAGAIKRWGLYREDLNAKEPMVDLGSVKIQNASLSGMTLPLDDPNRQPGVIDIRDAAEYQLNPDQNDSANILVRPGTPEELGIPNPVDGRTYGVVFEDVKPAPEEATLAEVCDHFQGEVVQKRLNDWCDRVHAAYLKVNPTTLTNWPKFLDEVHEIIGDDDPMRLPMAWLKTYGTVAAMAKSYEWLQPGEMETSSLTTAKTIGQNLVDQARRKQEE